MGDEATPHGSRRNWYARTPLYAKIAVGLLIGVIVGCVVPPWIAAGFNVPAHLVLRFLNAIAPPLIFLAVLRAVVETNVRGRLAGKMFYLLALNTVVAILVGLLVANVLRPGRHAHLARTEAQPHLAGNPVEQLIDNVPAACSARSSRTM